MKIKISTITTLLTFIVRNIGGFVSLFSSSLSFIGAMAPPFFVLSNINKIKIVDLCFILIGILFALLEPRSVRVLVSLLIVSIFIKLTKDNLIDLKKIKYFVGVMSIFLFLGLFVSRFYDHYWFGDRYKFFYDDATLLGAYLMPFIAVNLYFFESSKSRTDKSFFLLGVIVNLICLVATLSRMYIFLGGLAVLVFLFFYRKKIFYFIGIFFLGLVSYSFFKIDWNSLFTSLRLVSDDGGINLTGRGAIWAKFFEHLDKMSFFELFSPSLSSHLFYLNLELGAEGHSIAENSYFIVFLGGGIVFCIYFLLLLINSISSLLLFKKKLSLFYFISLLVVWFFDDSLAFPFSVFSQMFAFYVLYQIDVDKEKCFTEL